MITPKIISIKPYQDVGNDEATFAIQMRTPLLYRDITDFERGTAAYECARMLRPTLQALMLTDFMRIPFSSRGEYLERVISDRRMPSSKKTKVAIAAILGIIREANVHELDPSKSFLVVNVPRSEYQLQLGVPSEDKIASSIRLITSSLNDQYTYTIALPEVERETTLFTWNSDERLIRTYPKTDIEVVNGVVASVVEAYNASFFPEE